MHLLERVALDRDGVARLVQDAAACEHVTEATVATCNRPRSTPRSTGSQQRRGALRHRRARRRSTEALLPHLYVHYDGAVSTSSRSPPASNCMAVGEGQILGQTHDGLRVGQELGSVGPTLNVLLQQALHVGKRTRAETDMDGAAPTLVTAALTRAYGQTGDLSGRRVLVVGAGAWPRHRYRALPWCANRRAYARSASAEDRRPPGAPGRPGHRAGQCRRRDLLRRRHRPAREQRHGGRRADRRPADGAHGPRAARTSTRRGRPARRDLVTWRSWPPSCTSPRADHYRGAAHRLAQDATFLTARRQASVTPTVVALRSMATSVVKSEMERLNDTGCPPRRDRARRGAARRARVATSCSTTCACRATGQRDRRDLLRRRPGRAVRARPNAVDAVTDPE